MFIYKTTVLAFTFISIYIILGSRINTQTDDFKIHAKICSLFDLLKSVP